MGKKRTRKTRVSPLVSKVETPLGVVTTTETGIYTTTRRPASGRTPVEIKVRWKGKDLSMKGIMPKSIDEIKADSAAWNAEPQRTLALVRKAAIQNYAPHAVVVEDMKKPPLTTAMHCHELGDGLRVYQLPNDAPLEALEADRVLHECYDVETNTNAGYRLLAAFRLGRAYERMQVRQVEHRALAGLRQAKRNAKIAGDRALTPTQLEQRWQAVQDARDGGNVSRERAYKIVADKLDLTKAAIKKSCQAWDRLRRKAAPR